MSSTKIGVRQEYQLYNTIVTAISKVVAAVLTVVAVVVLVSAEVSK